MANPLPAKSAASRAYNAFNLASFTIGTKATNTIKVTAQLKGARGESSGRVVATAYLSDNADGSTLTATVPTSTLAIATAGLVLVADVTNKLVRLLTDSTGKFDLNVIQTASPVTYYLVVVLPDGSLSISSAITF